MMRKFFDSIFVRYLSGLVLVLMLPVVIYIFFYVNYYQKELKNIAEKQAINELVVVADTLDRYEQELKAIVDRNAFSKIVRLDKIGKYENVEALIDLLEYEKMTHTYLEEIVFYSTSWPEYVVCADGTYSIQYFKEYMGKGKQDFFYPSYVTELDSSGWIYLGESEIHWGKQDLVYIELRLHFGYDQYWLFHIDGNNMNELLSDKDGITIIHDIQGRQVYPYEIVEEDLLEDYLKFTYKDENSGLSFTRYIDEDSVFRESKKFFEIFIFSIILIVIFGSLLVLFLSVRQRKPIAELKQYCERKCQNIPDDIWGISTIHYTLDHLSGHLEYLNQKQKKEGLLYRTLYGIIPNCDELLEEFAELKMFLSIDSWYALVIKVESPLNERIDSAMLQLLLSDEQQEICLIDIEEDYFIGILGVSICNEEQIFKKLEKSAEKILNELGQRICIYIGKSCKQVELIHESFDTAITLSRGVYNDISNIISWKESENLEYQSGCSEIEVTHLYNAMLKADYQMIKLAMKVLNGIIEENRHSPEVYIPICYDILDVFVSAQAELQISDGNIEKFLNIKKFRSLKNPEEYIEYFSCLADLFVCSMKFGDDQISENQKDEFAKQIIVFIEQNKNHMDLSVNMIADAFQISVSNLSHRFKAVTGKNVSDYIAEQKFKCAVDLLVETDENIQNIAKILGYNQTHSFIRRFKHIYGMTPMEYRIFAKQK